MSVSQCEFVAYKTEANDRLKKAEDVVLKTVEDVKKLQEASEMMSSQAAPWSVTIETAVAASKAKAQAALTKVRSLYEGARAEVEDLRRRATQVETHRRTNGNCHALRHGAESIRLRGRAVVKFQGKCHGLC